MTLKYNIEVSNASYNEYIKKITNQIFKLLPLREEDTPWEKTLESLMLEIKGFDCLLGEHQNFLPVLSKLESLYVTEDFNSYRKTIFECLSLMDGFKVYG